MQAIKYLYLHPQPRYNKAIQRWRTPEYSAATLCTYLICRDGSAKIVGCYLPYLILNEQKSAWLWLPTALSLAVFVYLLTLHPAASGRIYAAYGGIYVCTALVWLHFVGKVTLSSWDMVGSALVVLGALTIILQPNGFSVR